MQSQNKPSKKILLATGLQFIFAIISIILAYQSLTAPADSSEFGGLKNAATGLFGILSIIISLVLILSAVFLFKLKRWAYILSLIFVPLSMLVLGAGSLGTLIFEISAGAPLSLTSEILPALVLVALLFCVNDFRKKKLN